jgi:hypothetical protein
MGRQRTKGCASKKASTQAREDLIWVDPERIRFQHSRIRPVFSGCGRSVVETLELIRRGDLLPSNLPPIQVLVGPESSEGPWYFSLNNRRLWVLKRCREEGLLEDNKIQVRVRPPKSLSELSRYTLENCAVEAKIIGREKNKPDRHEQVTKHNEATVQDKVDCCTAQSDSVDTTEHFAAADVDSSDDNSTCEDYMNPFSSLL